jgi:DNA repair exonuclease SbcCD nuclease subunit
MLDLLIADLHLTDKPSDAYRWETLIRLPTVVSDPRQVRRILVLGDITENKDKHSELLVNDMVELFSLWQSSFPLAKIIILSGNHCGITSDRAFFRFLSSIKGIEYVTVPTKIGEELFLPHTRDSDSWNEFRPFTRYKYQTVYMHQTVRGATAANSQTLEGMDSSIFEDVTLPVFSGDVHTKQTVDEHIHYIGSPYPIDFGDADGGYCIVRDNRGRYEYVQMPCPIKKRRLRVNHTSFIEDIDEQEDFAYSDSQFVIVVNITQSELVNWSSIKKSIQQHIESKGCHCVRVQADVIKNKNSTIDRRRRSPLAISPSEVVRRFAEQNQLDHYFTSTALDIVKGER